MAWAWQSSKLQVARYKLLQLLGPGPCGRPCSSTPLPSPTPPSTLLARPRRLTDSAADLPGPFHLSGCWLLACAAGCTAQKSQSHKVTVGEGAEQSHWPGSPGLVWPPMHKTGRQSLSLSSLSSDFACMFYRPTDLAAPFFAALLWSCPVLSCRILSVCPIRSPYIQDSSSLRRLGRLAVRLPPPRPFLNYTLHCAPRLVGSCRQNTTQPNPTQLDTRAQTHTHLFANLRYLPCSQVDLQLQYSTCPSRDARHIDLPASPAAPPSLSKIFQPFFFLASPLPFFKLVSAASSLAPAPPPARLLTATPTSQPQNRR